MMDALVRVGKFLWVLALAEVLGCAAPRELSNLAYDERFPQTRLDLYLPDGDAPHPIVLLLHGGSWNAGSRNQMQSLGRRLARSGYAAAAIDYRLGQAGMFPRSSQDVACAQAYLENNSKAYDIDPERTLVLGDSAGAHLAALLMTGGGLSDLAPDCEEGTPDALAGAVLMAGAYDLTKLTGEIVDDYLGENTEERARLASPRLHVSGREPPTLLFGGEGDWQVDEGQSTAMRDTLRRAGSPATLLRLSGGQNGLNPGLDPGELQSLEPLETPEGWLILVDFLVRTVGGS